MYNKQLRITAFTDTGTTCCFTGHRRLDENERLLAASRVSRAAEALIKTGVTNYIVGGALGFDTVAAVTLINMKRREISSLKIVVAVPCRGQDSGWRRADRALYSTILDAADEVIVLSEDYYPACMRDRNMFMVDNSAYCLSYVTKEHGGAYFTSCYAERKGLKLLNLACVGW